MLILVKNSLSRTSADEHLVKMNNNNNNDNDNNNNDNNNNNNNNNLYLIRVTQSNCKDLP